MSPAIAELSEARGLADALVKIERQRTGSRSTALATVARKVGASPGTIENLTRNRLKKIGGWLCDALRRRVVAELEAEITRLEHELNLLRQSGADPRSNEMAAVSADMAAVLAALGRRH